MDGNQWLGCDLSQIVWRWNNQWDNGYLMGLTNLTYLILSLIAVPGTHKVKIIYEMGQGTAQIG